MNSDLKKIQEQERKKKEHGNLMKINEVKIGAIGPDGKVINTKGEVKRIRNYIQQSLKLFHENKPIPPYISLNTIETNTEKASEAVPTKDKMPIESEKRTNISPISTEINSTPKQTSTSTATISTTKTELQTKTIPKTTPIKQKYTNTVTSKQVPQFLHQTQYNKTTMEEIYKGVQRENIHPSFRKQCYQCIRGSRPGTTTICFGQLEACIEQIRDFPTTYIKDYHKEQCDTINLHIQIQLDCIQQSFIQNSTVRQVKSHIYRCKDLNEIETRDTLIRNLKDFSIERIVQAPKVLATNGIKHIVDNDVIQTYGYCYAVEMTLLTAHHNGTRFRVIVIDAYPHLQGQRMVQNLIDENIPCEYTLINALVYTTRDATKVLLGTNAMLANGSMYATAGTAIVAMVAKTYCIPVLVCCETFKFSYTVQLDAICSNEIGDPDEIAIPINRDINSNTQYDELCSYKPLHDACIIQDFSSLNSSVDTTNNNESSTKANSKNTLYKNTKHFIDDYDDTSESDSENDTQLIDYHSKLESDDASLHDWKDIEHLNILNVLYDVTPVEMIMAVITEVGTIPPTSVPVILREFSDSMG